MTLPAIKNETGYTFLGWSTKPDQTQNPQYQAGQVIQVRKKTHLYAVMYNWQQEPDIQVNNLAAQLSEYSGIILWEIPERILCRKLFFGNMERMQLQKYHLYVRQGRD